MSLLSLDALDEWLAQQQDHGSIGNRPAAEGAAARIYAAVVEGRESELPPVVGERRETSGGPRPRLGPNRPD